MVPVNWAPRARSFEGTSCTGVTSHRVQGWAKSVAKRGSSPQTGLTSRGNKHRFERVPFTILGGRARISHTRPGMLLAIRVIVLVVRKGSHTDNEYCQFHRFGHDSAR